MFVPIFFQNMNIAFDAKRLYQNTTGLGQYSRTLVSTLATSFPLHHYFLCAPKLTNRFTADQYPNVHDITPTGFPGNILPALWRSNGVKRDLLQKNIDIYHGLSHEIPVGIDRTGIKSVVTIHDLIFERYPTQYNAIDNLIYRKKFMYACRHADRIIAISQQTKNDIVDFYNIAPGKIDVCYQSCNPIFGKRASPHAQQQIRATYNLPGQYFLYVGSIIERKNLLTICKALKIANLKIPLVVIGNGGKYKQIVQRYLAANGMEREVIFLSDNPAIASMVSYKTSADFPAIYQQALCLLYPSIFEGFGLPVLEALWSQTPVITSNISCLPETGGDAALYVDPYNETILATAMQKVATEDDLRKQMIAKGLQYAQNFTPEKCAAAVMDVYLRML